MSVVDRRDIDPRRCLSVAVPCFNEAGTVLTLHRAGARHRRGWLRWCVVDDGSDDGTAERARRTVDDRRGPRAAPRRQPGQGRRPAHGVRGRAASEYVIVQDADLEYDPDEYGVLLEPLERGVADVVYGSRFLGSRRIPQPMGENVTVRSCSRPSVGGSATVSAGRRPPRRAGHAARRSRSPPR